MENGNAEYSANLCVVDIDREHVQMSKEVRPSTSKCSEQNEGQWVWEKKENDSMVWNFTHFPGIDASLHHTLGSNASVLDVFNEILCNDFVYISCRNKWIC